MFKKLKPLVLLALFAALLLAVIFFLRMDTRRQQGSFTRELVNIDRSKTTSIVIIPKGMIESAITLEKNNGRWMVGSERKNFNANQEMIDQILFTLSPLIPEQLVARDEDSWHEYEVSETTGTRIKVFQGSRLSTDFIFGKIDFQSRIIQGQQRPKISTYVRQKGKDDVYLVDGFLGSSFPSVVNQYRDHGVIRSEKQNIAKISFTGPEAYQFDVSRGNGSWDISGIPADSANIAFYLNSLKLVHSNEFVEQEAKEWLTIPSHQMIIEQSTALPIEIKAFPADTTHLYFITSSQNPGAVFSGSHNGLFESIFYPKDFFLSEPE